MISDWQASIAKADAADWITVAAYLIAAVVSVQASKQAWLRREPKDKIFWRITAGLLIFLAVGSANAFNSDRSPARNPTWLVCRARTSTIYVYCWFDSDRSHRRNCYAMVDQAYTNRGAAGSFWSCIDRSFYYFSRGVIQSRR
jgi:hypothetical protein